MASEGSVASMGWRVCGVRGVEGPWGPWGSGDPGVRSVGFRSGASPWAIHDGAEVIKIPVRHPLGVTVVRQSPSVNHCP